MSFVMVTLTFCITIFVDLLEGKLTGNPEGVMKDEVSIKNINNRNIISVMDDMLKAGSTLCLGFNDMLPYLDS
jgi:hypothetical protein